MLPFYSLGNLEVCGLRLDEDGMDMQLWSGFSPSFSFLQRLSKKPPWDVSAPRVLVFSRTSGWCRLLQYHPNTKKKIDQPAQPQTKMQFDYLHKVPYWTKNENDEKRRRYCNTLKSAYYT